MKTEKMHIDIIGAAQSLGCGRDGVQYGPDYLRNKGLISKLQQYDLSIADLGNIYNDCSIICSTNEKLKNYEQIADFNERLASVVSNSVECGHFPLVLGGDHSLGIGSVSGVSNALGAENLCLIWVDAHTDINIETTTPTGNIHGMSIASLLGYGCDELARICGKTPKILPQNIIYVASRDIDEGEAEIISNNNIAVVHMNDIESNGIDVAVDNLQEIIKKITAPHIYLSIDIDVLDPQYAPGTGVPVPNGINKEQVLKFIDAIVCSGRVVGVELVEVNPLLDNQNNSTSKIAIDIIDYVIDNVVKNLS